MTEKAPDMDHDIRARVVTLEHSTADKERRLSELEAWKAQREIESARHDEKWNAMEARIDTRFSGLETSVGDIKKTLSHINWLIIGGIITGVVAFLIKGGFAP
ncbi:hypothetical protein JYP46_19405 [Nitratireductor aquimarinus]|uniref:hypothetical protein n=1 Tax=Alphaproteobacteria TaxID=28211 RepID=UPI0019D3E206|nr:MULTISPECIES: hypothetical protein [Alphaproteobacteria]MBY6023961.1 hypothetical protein [Nitratireductor sp. DP7N14-4]MBN7759000.1 hypothetical protein [Nitratireductor aquimarinus]MBN7763409.1 hypothetical protein [Nitratireductor aquibiodomus]MBY6001673.1 hypothetical protein [Tritonibacter mobilis]MDJ1465646.1 hypothetical protein [Nitratireductor sp. GZWM139]